MELAESAQILIGTILMIAGLVLAFVPILPGPVLLWAIAIIFAVVNQFQRMTPAAALAATFIMIAGSSSDLWLPLFGVKTGGMSCLGSIGAFVGGMVGTIILPIPLVGTLVGAVCGALLVELVRFRQLGQAARAGRTAFKTVLYSYVVQLIASFGIFVIYVVSLQTTRG